MAKTVSKKKSPKPAVTNIEDEVSSAGKSLSSSSVLFDSSLNDLLICGLRKMYWGELHLVDAIPKMLGAATSPALKSALEEHLEVTRAHAEHLEKVFDIINEKIIAQKCDAIEGLTIAGEKAINNSLPDSSIRDTAIIMSALKVETFEMISYKGLIDLARKLDIPDAIDIFNENLEGESEASDVLQALADNDNA